WMQRAFRPTQMLDRHHMASIDRPEETYAGIDALINQILAIELADQDRAGAAIALGATFLGAAKRTAQPEIIEEGFVRAHIGECDVSAIEQEAQFRANLDPGHDQLPL